MRDFHTNYGLSQPLAAHAGTYDFDPSTSERLTQHMLFPLHHQNLIIAPLFCKRTTPRSHCHAVNGPPATVAQFQAKVFATIIVVDSSSPSGTILHLSRRCAAYCSSGWCLSSRNRIYVWLFTNQGLNSRCSFPTTAHRPRGPSMPSPRRAQPCTVSFFPLQASLTRSPRWRAEGATSRALCERQVLAASLPEQHAMQRAHLGPGYLSCAFFAGHQEQRAEVIHLARPFGLGCRAPRRRVGCAHDSICYR
ncbi:hypothetical protein C8R47DRAFT_595717 [Mycena vitilis]|nr:hypothetical protein C8R47DRAFT_595717 [Mycena vitilis]